MDHLEWLLTDLKIPEEEPTPEEIAIFQKYQKEKAEGKVEFSKFV